MLPLVLRALATKREDDADGSAESLAARELGPSGGPDGAVPPYAALAAGGSDAAGGE